MEFNGRTDSCLRKCLVCGNRADGARYSVPTCDTCQFFIEYYSYHRDKSEIILPCPTSGQCLIDWKSGRICVRCLIRKCAQVEETRNLPSGRNFSTNNSALEGSFLRSDVTTQKKGVERKTAYECVVDVRRKLAAGKINAEAENCRVCGGHPSGVNYGVVTCTTCEGFFRTAHEEGKRIPSCRRNRRCVIKKTKRIRCKNCRLVKCFVVGMKYPKPPQDLTANSKISGEVPLQNFTLVDSDITPADISPPLVLLDDTLVPTNSFAANSKPTDPILSYNGLSWSEDDLSKVFGS